MSLRGILERRAEWIDVLIVLTTVAIAFVVLGYLASYFEDYFRIILIFFFAWLLAFLISPPADFLQRRLKRMPRALAVVGVIVPVIIIVAIIVVKVVEALAESFGSLAAALPGLAANPPPIISDIQSWFDAQGIDFDVAGTFHNIVTGILEGLANFLVVAFEGVLATFGTFIDAIIVVSLAVFMAIDRDKIMRFGLDLTPPERREDALLFRRSVGSAFAGFIRSQLVLGALYGLWALVVSFLFGLPYGVATAFLSGLIMAIPIYGPYVSWVPPVLVALLLVPDAAFLVAVFMLVGWFVDENILAPLVRAGALELHPIVVTFAFLLGAQLAGAIGALVAIPLAAVAQAFFFEYLARYRAARGWSSPEEDAAAANAPPVEPDPTPTASSPTAT